MNVGISSSWLISTCISISIIISRGTTVARGTTISCSSGFSCLINSRLSCSESFLGGGERIDDGLLSIRDGIGVMVGFLHVDLEGDVDLDIVAVGEFLSGGFHSSSRLGDRRFFLFVLAIIFFVILRTRTISVEGIISVFEGIRARSEIIIEELDSFLAFWILGANIETVCFAWLAEGLINASLEWLVVWVCVNKNES